MTHTHVTHPSARTRYCSPATIHQLGNLLEALGVEVTEERLREAFTELDLGREAVDGTLSFNDFEAWWTSSATS